MHSLIEIFPSGSSICSFKVNTIDETWDPIALLTLLGDLELVEESLFFTMTPLSKYTT